MNTAIRQKALDKLGFTPERWLLVDVSGQIVTLLHGDSVVVSWPVSTAAAGIDNRENSGGTPPGIHRVAQKIGAGHDPSSIFTSREPTGERWNGESDPRDLILGRILTLQGCEDGLNRGPGVDSLERYIYLHGTNHEDRIGEACSHGCIRLRRDDMVAVFDQVQADDPVVIV